MYGNKRQLFQPNKALLLLLFFCLQSCRRQLEGLQHSSGFDQEEHGGHVRQQAPAFPAEQACNFRATHVPQRFHSSGWLPFSDLQMLLIAVHRMLHFAIMHLCMTCAHCAMFALVACALNFTYYNHMLHTLSYLTLSCLALTR